MLGEAAAQLSADLKEQFPEIAWQQPSRLRNRIVHGYWSIDLEVLHTPPTTSCPHSQATCAGFSPRSARTPERGSAHLTGRSAPALVRGVPPVPLAPRQRLHVRPAPAISHVLAAAGAGHDRERMPSDRARPARAWHAAALLRRPARLGVLQRASPDERSGRRAGVLVVDSAPHRIQPDWRGAQGLHSPDSPVGTMVLEGDPSQGPPSSKKPCDSPELHLPVARDGLRCREVPEQGECD